MKNIYRENEIRVSKSFSQWQNEPEGKCKPSDMYILFEVDNTIYIDLSTFDTHMKSEFESKVQIFSGFYEIILFLVKCCNFSVMAMQFIMANNIFLSKFVSKVFKNNSIVVTS